MTNKELRDIVLQNQLYLERLKMGYVRGFRGVLQRMESALVEAVQKRDTQRMSDLTRKELDKLIAELRDIQLKLLAEGVGTFVTDLKRLATYQASFEGKVLKAAQKRVRVQAPKAQASFAEAVKKPMSATGELLEPFISDWTKREVAAVSNLVRKGYTNGWTNQQMTTAIRGTKKAGYADGLVARAERNAATIVRTSVQHVASTARTKTWAENADVVQEYRIVATLDNRTSSVCRSLDGQKFKLGAGPVPPLHPNCRTTTVAVLDDAFDFLDEGATRSSAQGYVDADLTYYDWLATQPATFQDEVLGRKRGKLFRAGGLSTEEFARLNLSRTFEPLTLDEMKQREPKAFKKAGI